MVKKTSKHQFKCPACHSDLTIACENKFIIEHVCTNKLCMNYVTPKQIFFKKLKNIKTKFYETWIYQHIISKFTKFLNWKFYKIKFDSLKSKMKYGVWSSETVVVDYSISKYAIKLLKASLKDQISWPKPYHSLAEWKTDIETCIRILEDKCLCFEDIDKWCKKHKTDFRRPPMHIVPTQVKGQNAIVFSDVKVNKIAFKKYCEIEDKWMAKHRKWFEWFALHCCDL